LDSEEDGGKESIMKGNVQVIPLKKQVIESKTINNANNA
jgi:hypothetical protein